MSSKPSSFIGLLVCVTIGIVSIIIAEKSPIDAVTLSILLGILVGNVGSIPTSWEHGITWSEKQLLGVAIALYGLTLDGKLLLDLGVQSALAVVVTIVITLRLSRSVGRIFKLDDTLSLSIGIGTAICGSAAI